MYVFAKQEEMKQAKYQGKKIASCHAGDSKTVHRYMGPRTFGGRNIRPFKLRVGVTEPALSHVVTRAWTRTFSQAGESQSLSKSPGPG